MNKLRGMLLAVLLLAVANAWGGCSEYTGNVRWDGSGYYFLPQVDGCAFQDMGNTACGFHAEMLGSGGFVCRVVNEGSCYLGSKSEGVVISVCRNQCESDSVLCVREGGTWTNTGASTCDGYSCKMSNCLQSDTLWLNDSKAACDAIGGENNYAIADIDETCVHSGICCTPDSALVGNTCKWRCDSIYTACTGKNGYLYAVVLQDTTISGEDSIFTNKCYYNCSYAYNKDSTTSVTDGNTVCSSPSTPIADCTRMPNDFSSVRTIYGDSVYSYDFLTPGSASYIDSIVLTPCSRFMYRCTINGKYRYWYSDADIPMGCTNIVKIK